MKQLKLKVQTHPYVTHPAGQMKSSRTSCSTEEIRMAPVQTESDRSNNLPDSFHVIGTTKATFYGERIESDRTAPTEQKATPLPKKTYPTVEETTRYIAELDRIQRERDSADIAAQQMLQEEKRRNKDRKRMEYERSRLLPQWKVTPGAKFRCSKLRKQPWR